MIEKTKEKEEAIRLRKQGLSYSEILRQVPVAKSTLSLWLRSVGLSKRQKQRLTEKKLAAIQRGWEACRKKRILVTSQIKREAIKEVGKFSKRDLWMVGLALYWAEGSKQKKHNVSQPVALGNSDYRVIKIFIKWLLEICEIPEEDICFWIALHKNAETMLREVQEYWSRVTGLPEEKFKKVSWKKNKTKTHRRNVGIDYYGLLRIYVRRSTGLNRRIEGWIEGICKNTKIAG